MSRTCILGFVYALDRKKFQFHGEGAVWGGLFELEEGGRLMSGLCNVDTGQGTYIPTLVSIRITVLTDRKPVLIGPW